MITGRRRRARSSERRTRGWRRSWVRSGPDRATVPGLDETARMYDATSPFAHLNDRFRSRNATIGVVGLGYVGLPLALAALKAGFSVIGFDINPARVAAINAGERVSGGV